MNNRKKSITYKSAGVDIDEASRAVDAIKPLAKSTFNRNVLTGIGSFGACFALPKLRQPVLISSVDGVGTKLKIAFATGRHDTVGEDLVNHCVNDIAVQGAIPLFFLDYLAVGKLDAKVAAALISGIARGCRANGCALIGGETAEMPGLYRDGEYDLAGAIVGAAGKSELITGDGVRAGDLLIGLPSSGLHTNGYSLARKLLFEVAKLAPGSQLQDVGLTVAEELLKVHRSYLRPIQGLHKARILQAAAHITGGGITDNVPRVLPKGLAAMVRTSSWQVPPIFELLRKIGDLEAADYRRTFNLGIGMVLVVAQRDMLKAERVFKRLGEPYLLVGEIAKQRRGRGQVEYL
jgi:phosphoribosylformylglycinamidine cyclo-ligase